VLACLTGRQAPASSTLDQKILLVVWARTWIISFREGRLMTNKTRQRDPWGLEIVQPSGLRTRSPAPLYLWGNRAAAVLVALSRFFLYAALSADPSARLIAQEQRRQEIERENAAFLREAWAAAGNPAARSLRGRPDGDQSARERADCGRGARIILIPRRPLWRLDSFAHRSRPSRSIIPLRRHALRQRSRGSK